jgi:preprotein translocase subunit SecG
VSSLAVWLLGPLVKTAGFDALLLLMAAIAIVTLCVVLLLPRTTGRGLGAGADEAAARAAD